MLCMFRGLLYILFGLALVGWLVSTVKNDVRLRVGCYKIFQ